MIKAKPVIPDQYWILKENDRKVGNIEANASGFSVKINNETHIFKSIGNIKQQVDIDFETIEKNSSNAKTNEVYGYPTSSYPYNAIYNVKHQVPLWTRDEKSKSWYAAGWFLIKQGRRWESTFCPKLITIQRYPYQGPFKTKEEMHDKSV